MLVSFAAISKPYFVPFFRNHQSDFNILKQAASVFRIYLTDIRFWIVVFFLLRLYGITDAPLETGHNWRQVLTNMVARNFYKGGLDMLYPRVDLAGNATGITGAEYPFFNFLIYLVSIIFDYSHWYGRLINLVVSSCGIFYFYKLLAGIFNRALAFNAAVILLVSIWYSFSRKIMPDTFSVSLVIIGLYCGYRYLLEGRKLSLLGYFLFITLGVLCKIPALSLVAVVSVLYFAHEIVANRRALILISTVLSGLVVSFWYFYWVPYLLTTYGYQSYFPKGVKEGFFEILPLMPEYFKKFYFSALNSYIAFALVIYGVILGRNAHAYIKVGMLAITFIFILFTIKTGAVFPTHNYYIIPFVPVMAMIAGYGLYKVPSKFRYILLGLLAIEGIINQLHDFKMKDEYKLQLEGILDAHIPADALIVINGGASPQSIYFANRKGWTVENEMIQESRLDSLQNLGAAYLVLDREAYPEEIGYYEPLYQGSNFNIYSMDNHQHSRE